jgi:[CysO sulfur-carrier protein]-S-L-cysteine hydrolase
MDRERHPWILGNLRVPRAVLDVLAAEAEAAYGRDEEACGYVTGPATEALVADQAVIMPNLANKYHALDPESYPRKGNMYFLLDARKFEKAIAEGETSGRPVKVLWHSHLDVGAYFSETDAAAANMGGDAPANDLAYLVTSVRKGKVDDHRLFVWDPGTKRFVESPLVVS